MCSVAMWENPYIGMLPPSVQFQSRDFSHIVISNQKQPSCKKRSAALEKAMVKKRCEIQGGGQEMAVMVG